MDKLAGILKLAKDSSRSFSLLFNTIIFIPSGLAPSPHFTATLSEWEKLDVHCVCLLCYLLVLAKISLAARGFRCDISVFDSAVGSQDTKYPVAERAKSLSPKNTKVVCSQIWIDFRAAAYTLGEVKDTSGPRFALPAATAIAFRVDADGNSGDAISQTAVLTPVYLFLHDMQAHSPNSILHSRCDGGKTACALRAVCKRLRSAMEPYRFHTVALEWRTQMITFAEVFKASSDIAQTSIRHLFVLFDIDFVAKDDAVRKIITRSAPRLRSLFWIINRNPPSVTFNLIYKTRFPRLVHLTLWHRDLTARVSHSPEKILYPSLKYLHIASDAMSFEDGHTTVESLVRCHVPHTSLLNIRLSGVVYKSKSTSLELFANVVGFSHSPTGIVKLPPNVTCYTLEMTIDPAGTPVTAARDIRTIEAINDMNPLGMGGLAARVLIDREPVTAASQWKGEWLKYLQRQLARYG
ncbi:hypothetical protein OE88DRAFT_1725962 [Heliocybe sulcata]|uniref:Uncharacterized protein n=1 Tax=Heliocybe sulcata TaxID=5364 RepID=A0A5C3NAC8_9AGAM|nr:hypothetical protein OE88DRAFT_1725962 [Heliocybe sulcata]